MKRLFIVIMAVVALVLALLFAVGKVSVTGPSNETAVSTEKSVCAELANQARNLVASANYCEADSDCRWQLYGSPFECYSLVNKDFVAQSKQLDVIFKERRNNNCGIVYQDIDCDTSEQPPSTLKCLKSVCVDTR